MACDVTNYEITNNSVNNVQSVWKALINSSHLAPDKHSAKNDLKTIKEIVSHDDNSGTARSPSFTRTDSLDARRCGKCWINTFTQEQNKKI